MASADLGEIMRLLDRGIASQSKTLDPVAEQVQGWLKEAVKQGGPSVLRAKDCLHGTWLGHALHPALTDVPIGAWWTAAFMDLAGVRRGADWAVGLGTLAAIPTALSGLADWTDTQAQPRRLGLVHAALNSVGLGCMVGSLLARRSGDRGTGIALSTVGLALTTVSAWLGGEMVYRLGTAVSRNAFEPTSEGFVQVGRMDELPEGKLARVEAKLDGEAVPLVLLRRGKEVLALSATCSHLGGPLDEGTLDGEVVQCPWHGSRFSMRDGSVQQGPASVPQPCFETRVRAGRVEVRRAS